MQFETLIDKEIESTKQLIADKQVELNSCNERSADDSDIAANVSLRRSNEFELTQLQTKLKRLTTAKAKLSSGDFGFCEECGIEIPEKRLMHNLGCENCVDCQSVIELKNRQYAA